MPILRPRDLTNTWSSTCYPAFLVLAHLFLLNILKKSKHIGGGHGLLSAKVGTMQRFDNWHKQLFIFHSWGPRVIFRMRLRDPVAPRSSELETALRSRYVDSACPVSRSWDCHQRLDDNTDSEWRIPQYQNISSLPCILNYRHKDCFISSACEENQSDLVSPCSESIHL